MALCGWIWAFAYLLLADVAVNLQGIKFKNVNKMSEELEKDFLEIHKEGLEHIGFWREEYIEIVQKSIENRYKTEVIRNYCVTEISIKDRKVLVKWVKRYEPLSDEELSENYGR